MKEYAKVLEEVDAECRRVCNRCGKEIVNETLNFDMITEVKVVFGWGSNKDGQRWDFDLCDDCLDDMASGFMFPPTVSRYM